MKITDRFVGDHKTFRKLMADIRAILADESPPAAADRLPRLLLLLRDHLLIHGWAEETFFYPVIAGRVAETGSGIDRRYMAALDAEHGVIDDVVERLDIARDLSAFDAFAAALNAHMEKEERGLFPFAETLLGAEALERMSTEAEKRRKQEAPRIVRRAEGPR